MKNLTGIAKTLFIPLYARISISKKFPDFFYDESALRLESIIPHDVISASNEYTDIASVTRYYILDAEIINYIRSNGECNIVQLGVGFDTAYSRMQKDIDNSHVHYYGVDLPEVLELRNEFLGKLDREMLICADMFTLEWCKDIDVTLPTFFVVSGVFQYFTEQKIIDFISKLKNKFSNAELIFDATNKQGLRMANRYVRKSGSSDAMMYLYIDDAKDFGRRAEIELIKAPTFYKSIMGIVYKRLNLRTKLYIWISEIFRMTIFAHYRLN